MLQTALLAFSLSSDAFAVSIANGARAPRMSIVRTTTIAASFGLLEAVMPLIGYLLGRHFAGAIESVDHWIAFAILGFLGVRMIWMSFKTDTPTGVAMPLSVAAVFATALGTSVDATAVGVTLALVETDIAMTLLAIGFVTFAMAWIGLHLGREIGRRAGAWAERFGGLGLIAIGSNILITHLAA
ncbi:MULTISPECIES: manganese efflux pump MntP family protein [unclassified Beijerinckia]|uniref:manganese efflux pump MntP n=1 Tax=unclassified Beijerinckia TaxID=2638183 RepID=UPI0008979A35|nr:MULTISPECIES: manganese efflux pump MntP family protein [unclassified Beijerinckia]MDH7794869.1 putative Mn2+ efflux pump MntP [Beijerinckia sp. GAS462]SEB78494.1 Putative Mn2+ efflux pump MntP [Beijerinckia sp. 28-YEA-48]